MVIVIEFDGGTSCNVPSRGYGIGYGSFKIGDLPVERVDHGRPMSANVAEIMTAVAALDKALNIYGRSEILIRGDSEIALKWLGTAHAPAGKLTRYPARKNSESFVVATQAAFVATMKHQTVKTEWRSRDHSVRLFGH